MVRGKKEVQMKNKTQQIKKIRSKLLKIKKMWDIQWDKYYDLDEEGADQVLEWFS